MRNIQNYEADINFNNVTLTGIKDSCTLNDIDYFHVTNNYAVDIMRDLFERVCCFEISLLLYQFIITAKLFTLETLNSKNKSF